MIKKNMSTVRSELLGKKHKLRELFVDVYVEALKGLDAANFNDTAKAANIKVAVFKAVQGKLLTKGCLIRGWLAAAHDRMHISWVEIVKMLTSASPVGSSLTDAEADELTWIETSKMALTL